jgi:G3E family GTPase
MAIPLTLITGFLGSGKTTLIEKIISLHPKMQFGVIENEAAEINLDGQRLKENTTAWVEQTQGCLCCQIQGDLLPALKKVIQDSPKPLDHLILETTGLADPAPLVQALLGIGPHQELVRLDSVICLVDAIHFHRQLSDLGENSELKRQIVYATQVLISKTDCIGPNDHQSIAQEISHLNPGVEIHHHHPNAPLLENLLEQRAFEAQSIQETLLKSIRSIKKLSPRRFQLQAKTPEHQHVDVQVKILEVPGELNPQVFELFLNITLAQHASALLRSKGVLAFAHNAQKILFQGVYDRFGFELGEEWKTDEKKVNQLVLIGHPEMILMWERGLKNAVVKS